MLIILSLTLACFPGLRPKAIPDDPNQDYDEDGFSENDGDCNDLNANVHPNAQEECDLLNVDENCDGLINGADAVDAITWYLDQDGDRFGDPTVDIVSCTQPEDYIEDNSDCNDEDPRVYPGSNNEMGLLCVFDGDGDGYGDLNPPAPFDAGTDCDDSDDFNFPNNVEYCDGKDNNCNTEIDDGNAIGSQTWYLDFDNDGYGTTAASLIACTQPSGYSLYTTDCDDSNSTAYPNAAEYCDGVDNNCDGTIDETTAVDAGLWYLDSDGDGFGQDAASVVSCTPPSNYVSLNTDCNDQLDTVYPAAPETCDGIDNNCDGTADEATAIDASLWFFDSDNDGYGNDFNALYSCTQPSGYIADNTDCNDSNSSIHPAAIESCNTIDDNCDGVADGSDAIGQTTYYIDADGDGFGNTNHQSITNGSFLQCASQFDSTSGYVTNSDDCDDSDNSLNPNSYWYVDADLDGYGNDSIFFQSCQAPFGYISSAGDCDDTLAEVYPGAIELCNGRLDNCNTTTGLTNGIPSYEHDFDEDGFVECTPDVATNIYVPSSNDPSYTFQGGEDCDDNDEFTYPAAAELCNGAFEDCSDPEYSTQGAPDTEIDDDGDSFVECIGFDINLWEGDSDVYDNALLGNGGGNDCDDTRDYTYPGAAPQSSATECLTDFDGDGFADCRFGPCDTTLTINGEQIDFVNIPAGTFMMGSPTASFYREVTLSNDFEIMTTHVTVGMFSAVMGYPHTDGVSSTQPQNDQSSEYPVSWISWHMAADFSNALTQYHNSAYGTTLQECYSCTGSGIGVSCTDIVNAYQCTGYRLLTEAEWEYVAKSGSSNDFWTPSGGGDVAPGEYDICGSSTLSDGSSLGDLAWYVCNNTGNGIQDVAQKTPNGFGVYDMAGNMNQWTHDESCPLVNTPITDPACTGSDPSSLNTPRVIKGGTYFYFPQSILPQWRDGQQALFRDFYFGFRIGKTQ